MLHYPKYVTYTTSLKCNAKCEMCDSWKRERHDELTLDEVDTVFSQLKKIDAIRISGGEPFIRDDINEIVEIIDRRVSPDIIHITTNGYFIDEVLKVANNSGISSKLHFKVSIDGREEKHDRIRKLNNGYRHCMELVKKLKEISKEKNNIFVGVNQTIIDKEGLEDYGYLKSILEPLGVSVHVVVAYNDSAFYNYSQGEVLNEAIKFKPYGDFEKRDIQRLLSKLKSDSKSIDDFIEKLVKKYYLKGLENRLIHDIDKPNPKCTSTYSHLRIMPNGDVPVCLYNTQSLGNLRTESFKDIWFSDKNKKHRGFVDNCHGCWAGCEVIPSAVYSGDIYKALGG